MRDGGFGVGDALGIVRGSGGGVESGCFVSSDSHMYYTRIK